MKQMSSPLTYTENFGQCVKLPVCIQRLSEKAYQRNINVRNAGHKKNPLAIIPLLAYNKLNYYLLK